MKAKPSRKRRSAADRHAKKKPIEAPAVVYDLQNLPFDPAEAFRQEVRHFHKKKEH